MSKIFKADTFSIDEKHKVNIKISQYKDLHKKIEDDLTEESIEKAKNVMEEYSNEMLKRANAKSEDIISSAEISAAKIMQEMIDEAEQMAIGVEEASHKKGYEDGYNQGLQEAEAIKNNAMIIIEEAQAYKAEILNNVNEDIANIIYVITNKITHNCMSINPQIINALVKQGLMESTMSGTLTIHISEFDYAEVSAQKNELLSLIDASVKLEILRDLSLNQGDCIIETPFGNVDCSLDQQIKNLKEHLILLAKGN